MRGTAIVALVIGVVGAGVVCVGLEVGADGRGGVARAAEAEVRATCTLIAGAKVYLRRRGRGRGRRRARRWADPRGRRGAQRRGMRARRCAWAGARRRASSIWVQRARPGRGGARGLDRRHRSEERAPGPGGRGAGGAVRASLGYNARSIAIQVARGGGVTSSVVVPTSGIISGGAFWADLAGGTRAGVKREPAAMTASVGALSESRAASMYVIDLALKPRRCSGRRSAARGRRTSARTSPTRRWISRRSGRSFGVRCRCSRASTGRATSRRCSR